MRHRFRWTPSLRFLHSRASRQPYAVPKPPAMVQFHCRIRAGPAPELDVLLLCRSACDANRRAMNSKAVDIVEQAVFLLRSCPASAWAVEAAGAIPLLLSVLYFAFDMTTGGALLCAVSFLWFNVCRARFAQLLMSALSDQSPEKWKHAFDPVNLAVQSSKLFTMPLALLSVIPFGWTVAFFRTTGIFAGRRTLGRNA